MVLIAVMLIYCSQIASGNFDGPNPAAFLCAFPLLILYIPLLLIYGGIFPFLDQLHGISGLFTLVALWVAFNVIQGLVASCLIQAMAWGFAHFMARSVHSELRMI